jgi:PAS domain S-box-containing protein
MTTLRECAEAAATALTKKLRKSRGEVDEAAVADIIENVLSQATKERDKGEKKRLVDLEASMQERLTRLLDASPAVIYSFKAKDDYAPIFVSANIETLFGYAPREYLGNPNFWRERVHPDDLERVEAEVTDLFTNGKQTIEYRFRRKDGSYVWVNDAQLLVRDEKSEPLEIVGSWSDISDRKRAEEAEDAAQARLALLLEAAPAVIYSFKASGDYAPTFVSENIKKLLGYCPDKYLKNADFWRKRVHPDDLASVEAEQVKVFEHGAHSVEYRFRNLVGSYRWLADEQHLIRDENGEPLEIVGSWSDITARKKAEEAEDALQARLSLLLESAPAVIYSFKASGDFAPTFVSENIKRLLGYCPDKYLKNADFWRKRVHPDDLASVETEQAKVFEHGHHSVEYRFRNLDGSYRWLSDEQHLIHDDQGQPKEIVGSWSDITARKKAEEAEDALQARMALLLETAPAVVYSFKASGDFAPTFISENVKRVLGYCPDEYLKNADFWRRNVHPEDLAAVEAEQGKLFETGSHAAEYRFRKKDGAYCWVADEQHLIRDRNGQPFEVVGSWSEVTARKTAEQAALAASEQRLTDAVESISEGFSLYDTEDRLVLGNYKYKELFDFGDGPPEPGTQYEDILRKAVEQGVVQDAMRDPRAWIEDRLRRHRNPGEPVLEHRIDGRWIQVSERRTENAGRVAVYSDLTELKESEQRAAAANQLILQSLRYARRIQAAILPQRRELAMLTADHFLIWEPRDIVGGDFFWTQELRDGHAIVVGDCTGHGVPGAFMTLVAWGMLDRMLQSAPSENPSHVLTGLHRGVQSLLGQDQKTGETDDGLEAGVCFVNPERQKMTFAGARFSLWKTNESGVMEIKGDRKGIGYRRYPKETTFTDITLPYRGTDSFYMTTDGLIDQIGGPRGRSFGKYRFQQLLKKYQGHPMQIQAEAVREELAKYQGDQMRRDDLTILGFVPLGR